MMSLQVHKSSPSTSVLASKYNLFSNHANISKLIRPRTATTTTVKKNRRDGVLRVSAVVNPFEAVHISIGDSVKLTSKVVSTAADTASDAVDTSLGLATTLMAPTGGVKAVVSVKVIAGGLIPTQIEGSLNGVTDLIGRSLELQLVSADAKGGAEGQRITANARQTSISFDEVKYEASFKVPDQFGDVGAVVVENAHGTPMYLNDIVISNIPNGPVTVSCNSWVHSKWENPDPRVFFTDKSYLPSETPSGIRKLREQDLSSLRGNGQGERKEFDRIYDYDVYNDLGEPDDSEDNARPVLGGPDRPYPRRCRTGRGPTKTDPLSERRVRTNYVPKDEAFSLVKKVSNSWNQLNALLSSVIPYLEAILVDSSMRFPHFTRIDLLFDQGIPMPEDQGVFKLLVPRLIKKVKDSAASVLLFTTPEMMDRDRFSWIKDEEFSRQTLAGMNPLSIELVTEWPMKSKLDPKVFGTTESGITKEIVEKEIKGYMTFDEALAQKKLFVLDYHDLLLPYVQKVRQLEGRTLYGSRTLLFNSEHSTLMPIAIELTRPPIDGKPEWKHVYTPSADATNAWLWKYAKTHVSAHDAGYHQLVSHWLRTHACMEPFIIAANRQLSVMHPIYRLLKPHFRYTMEINALARSQLINANGIIESSFSPGKYSIELSSVGYDLLWRFDMEALPADLIRRGMAVADPSAEHGVKLTIEDYPYANDGLVLWDAIKTWVSDYVNHYYKDSKTIESDKELQDWWTEVRTKGHEDKKDEPWWPVLNSKDSLIQTLTTIMWVGSGHHAAVNFGQYHFAGYFPHRPSNARTRMPNEDPTFEEYKKFMVKPWEGILECLPTQIQAVKVMAVLDSLSAHSPDEEYIGDSSEPSWLAEPAIKAAYERFSGRIKELEGIIDGRNSDPQLSNRVGAGIVPYELLKPMSEPGITGMGVPNSISI